MSAELLRTDLLVEAIMHTLASAGRGHCLRIDHFPEDEALRLCEAVRARRGAGTDFHCYLLASRGAGSDEPSEPWITTDRAIELRNRKEGVLCLFVPAYLVDAAASSLSNSFASVSGGELHRQALTWALERLPGETRETVERVFRQLHGRLIASDEARLDFACAALARVADGAVERLGLDLWRVGLIADSRTDFAQKLTSNRTNLLKLTRPAKLHATARERIQTLGVDEGTARALALFFVERPMHDARSWSRALAEGDGPTFDTWQFIGGDQATDLLSVTISPFIDAQGAVVRGSKLQQPDGPGGPLFAKRGEKERLTVRWRTDPATPRNVQRWSVALHPADDDGEREYDLPAREVAGSRRTTTLPLNVDGNDLPDCPLVVRVAALDGAGNEMTKANGEPLVATSDEFYLTDELVVPETPREKRRTVPTLALGRLMAAQESGDGQLVESQPQWHALRDLLYFSLRLNERRILNVALSELLVGLQRRAIEQPKDGGRFSLRVDEVMPVRLEQVEDQPIQPRSPETWATFLQRRANFLDRLRRAHPRDVVEVADWNDDLCGAALRYAQAYTELLDQLRQSPSARAELGEALSIDSLRVSIAGATADADELAIVTLPTHPLRAAWMAGYTQLLRVWEDRVLELASRERKHAVDIEAVRLLSPMNVPAFSFWDDQTPLVFFQNLLFAWGVSLAPGTLDPHRQFADVATILGAGDAAENTVDLRAEDLAEQLQRYHKAHPYIAALRVALVNPDQGDFFAHAVEHLRRRQAPASGDDEEAPTRPALVIDAYVEDLQKASLGGIERLRAHEVDDSYRLATDALLPGLSTTVRTLDDLEADAGRRDVNLAVVTDFTLPEVVSAPADDDAGAGSLTLYGLLARFVTSFANTGERLQWRHRLLATPDACIAPHPAGGRTSDRYSETLIGAHAATLRASGDLLGQPGAVPALQVELTRHAQVLVERLHRNADWVVTVDRFFGMEYFDSPHAPGLEGVARKYLIDYSPEFTEGLGHRLVVTTAWREEIETILARAMHELGFDAIDDSVGQVLHYLKMVSGRLALRLLSASASPVEAVGLGVVAAWLHQNGRLGQAVLLPVDPHRRLFTNRRDGEGQGHRADLMLVSLRRNIVDATFIEVKWRRGRTRLEELADDMMVQMRATADAIQARFFDEHRIDGALQRAYLANILRFYLERARRYGSFDPQHERSFQEHLNLLEKETLSFRRSFEGFIVSLDDEPCPPRPVEDGKIRFLTARDCQGVAGLRVEARDAGTAAG